MEELENIFHPLLETPRLLLSPLEIKDAKAISEIRSDKIVNQYIRRADFMSIEAAIKFIKTIHCFDIHLAFF